MDFNTAKTQRNFDTIAAGTVAALHLTIRPGGGGEGGWLKPSRDGKSLGLDCELVILDGEYTGRKFWTHLTVSGETDGHKEAAQITAAKLRAVLESARGVRPDDTGEGAMQARRVDSYGDFDGLHFLGKIGVEPARNGYAAKNTLAEVITPERTFWRQVEQAPKTAVAPTATAQPTEKAPAATVRPAWAQ